MARGRCHFALRDLQEYSAPGFVVISSVSISLQPFQLVSTGLECCALRGVDICCMGTGSRPLFCSCRSGGGGINYCFRVRGLHRPSRYI